MRLLFVNEALLNSVRGSWVSESTKGLNDIGDAKKPKKAHEAEQALPARDEAKCAEKAKRA